MRIAFNAPSDITGAYYDLNVNGIGATVIGSVFSELNLSSGYPYEISYIGSGGYFALTLDRYISANDVNGHTVETDVPTGAKFTDTIYTHPTTPGNFHIPSGGTPGQILRWDGDGNAWWGDDNDTIYVHPTTSGNKHIPSGGSTGLFLKYDSDGTAVWAADNDTTYSNATTSTAGLMSATDKSNCR